VLPAWFLRRFLPVAGGFYTLMVNGTDVRVTDHFEPLLLPMCDTGVGPWGQSAEITRETIGWTDCGHDTWRRGIVLDPFGGTGTSAVVANRLGRDAILIDLDPRNVELASQRVGYHLEVKHLTYLPEAA